MVRTRSTNPLLLPFDSEIEKTLSNLRKEIRDNFRNLPFNQEEEGTSEMGDANRTLKELTAPNLQTQPLAVTFPALANGNKFEFKAAWIQFLPKFHGLSGEDPNKHLAEFHAIIESIRPGDVTED